MWVVFHNRRGFITIFSPRMSDDRSVGVSESRPDPRRSAHDIACRIPSRHHLKFGTTAPRRPASLPGSPEGVDLALLRIQPIDRPILPRMSMTAPCASPPPFPSAEVEDNNSVSPHESFRPSSTDPTDEYIRAVASERSSWSCIWISREFPFETCGYKARRHLVKRHINCVHLKIR